MPRKKSDSQPAKRKRKSKDLTILAETETKSQESVDAVVVASRISICEGKKKRLQDKNK